MRRLFFLIVALLLISGCGGSAGKDFYKDKNTDKPVPAEKK